MDYNFSYSTTAADGTPIDVSLVITTSSLQNPDGSYFISGITGTWNGQTVTGYVDPNNPNVNNYGGSDGRFYPNITTQPPTITGSAHDYADYNGFDFTVDTTGPNAIAGDDGLGTVNFHGGDGPNGNSDAEYTAALFSPATNEVLTPACYCRGTRIRTPAGSVPIETLAEGDWVVTADGALEPIVWLGRRSYAGRVLAANAELLPVRIMQGALGDGMPGRDLLVSPRHAMYLDGILVEAADLINGVTIVRERGLARVEYFHIELSRHAVIWAEDAPSETFANDGSRDHFHNAATYRGPASTGPAVFCAPRAFDGFAVEAIRASIARRAGIRAAA